VSKVYWDLAATVHFVTGKHIKSMVPCVSQKMSKTKTFPLKKKLKLCIYVATCVRCREQYVGPKHEQIFPEMVIAPQYVEQTILLK